MGVGSCRVKRESRSGRRGVVGTVDDAWSQLLPEPSVATAASFRCPSMPSPVLSGVSAALVSSMLCGLSISSFHGTSERALYLFPSAPNASLLVPAFK